MHAHLYTVSAEFSLVVEELWRRVERKWKESERQQEKRWATVTEMVERIAEDVRELLDGLVPEEKEMQETEAEEMQEIGAETERDRDGDIEVDEMLREMRQIGREGSDGGVKSLVKILFVNKKCFFLEK